MEVDTAISSVRGFALSRPSFEWKDPDRCQERGHFVSKQIYTGMHPLIIVCFCVMALSSLLSLLGRTSIANMRTFDIVHLIVAGMTFGMALVALVGFFVFRHRGPD